MKKTTFTAIALFCVCFAFAQTPAEDAELEFERGRVLVHQKQFNKAIAIWDSLANLNISPDYKAKYLSLCGVLERDSNNNSIRAIEYFMKAESLYPELMEIKEGPADAGIVYSSMGLANYCDTLKDYSRSIGHYEKALALINNFIMEGLEVNGKDYNELNLMALSFKQSIAANYGRNRQFEESQSAFEELKFEYGRMELSDNPEQVMQGWLFNCIVRQSFATMYEQDMKNMQKAKAEANQLVDKIMSGMNSKNSVITEAISDDAPAFLAFAARINLKARDISSAITLCNDALTCVSDESLKAQIINTKGEAYLVSGRVNEARKCWLEAKGIVPDFYDNDKAGLPLRDKFGRK